MGIQATIKTADLRAAGVVLNDFTTEHMSINDEGVEELYLAETTELVFPNGFTYCVHGQPIDKTLWIDFNHWGNNRKLLEPVLAQYGIPFTEA